MIRSCSKRSASRDLRLILSRDLRRTLLWLGLGTSGQRRTHMGMTIGRLVALPVLVFAFATVAWAAGPEVDPASVSEGLKAIFKYGKGQRETAERLNTNTVTL